MKIFCLIRSLNLGGAERQMMGLAHDLSAAGHDVALIVYHKGNYYQKECETSGVKAVFLEKGLTSLGFSVKLASFLKQESADVLVSFLPGPNKKACVARLLYPRFRLIVSERNFNIIYLPHDFLRFSIYRFADRVVCNNHSQETFTRERCSWLVNKLSTIVNFAPVETYTPSVKKEHNSVRKIVVAARLCPRKNPRGLVKAASLLKNEGYNFQIEWYGAEPGGYKKKIEKMIERYGVQDVFSILPASHDMLGVYRSADIFCLPSFYEGTSNAVAEALCCGLPIVASNVSDTPRYVIGGKNGFLCNPNDVGSVMSALKNALRLSDKDMDRFGKSSREIVENGLGRRHFSESWQNIVSELEKL